MKTFSKTANKWILSTMMIAALGSQYYYSVSSNNYGSFELSSTAAEELSIKLKELEAKKDLPTEAKAKEKAKLIAEYSPKIEAENKPKPATAAQAPAAAVQVAATPAVATPAKQIELTVKPAAAAKPAEAAKPVAAQAKPIEVKAPTPTAEVAPKTEGQTTEVSYIIDCDSCNGDKKFVLSKVNLETANKLAALLNPVKKPAEVKTAEPKKEETVAETDKERRERLKEEKEEKKRAAKEKKEEAKQAKADKLREEKEARTEAFTEKVEEIAERCENDLTCKVDRLSFLMQSYSGSKKIDSSAVTKAYNTLIDKDLKAGLRAENGSESKLAALDALEQLMGSELPSEYRSIKTRAVDSAKYAQVNQATNINELYRQADVYKSQNKTTEEVQTRGLAIQADRVFRQEAGQIYRTMYEGLSSVSDNATMDYVRSNYLPSMNEILNRLTNPSGISTTTSTSTGSRAGRTGNSTNVNISNGTTAIGSGNSLQNVNFGTPSTNRSVNRTGVAIPQ